jgi:hypothetical protein
MPYSHLPEEDQDRQRRIDFNATFGSETGFRVLQDLVLNACHLYRPSVEVNDNHAEVFFREGERRIGLYIMEKLGEELRSKIL